MHINKVLRGVIAITPLNIILIPEGYREHMKNEWRERK